MNIFFNQLDITTNQPICIILLIVFIPIIMSLLDFETFEKGIKDE